MSGESDLRELVASGASFLAIIAYLSARHDGSVSAIQLLLSIQEEVGIRFVETRKMLEYFNPDWELLVAVDVIDERWRSILAEINFN